jgi:hypothetical protein
MRRLAMAEKEAHNPGPRLLQRRRQSARHPAGGGGRPTQRLAMAEKEAASPGGDGGGDGRCGGQL